MQVAFVLHACLYVCVGGVSMVLDDGAGPEKLDEILAAVKETKRGRWFLETYESRLRANDTSKILAAIATLERQIQSMDVPGSTSGLLIRARAAIAQARKDILDLPSKPPELSAEGQLFAKLASLSKQQFPHDSATSKGVDRALRLVAELDLDFSVPGNATEAKQFFKQDEAVFEPAPGPKPVVLTTRNEAPAEMPPRGAKLIIQRIAPSSLSVEPGTPQVSLRPEMMQDVFAVEPELQPPLPSEQPMATADAPEIAQSRIVIIRRKADEMDDVPLFEVASGISATAAEATVARPQLDRISAQAAL